MAEDKVELRDVNFRQLLPWTELFRGFQVALDPKKLLLAAGGILVMAIGWWFWSWLFYQSRSEPTWVSGDYTHDASDWERFKADRRKWNLLYEAAGDPSQVRYYDADDLAVILKQDLQDYGKVKTDLLGKPKPVGKMRVFPWFEDRGPNPILLVSGNTEAWERGHFWDWLLRREIPNVLLEPLVKFFRPVVYLLHPDAGFWNSVYFVLVLLWTLATWAFFGGAITRMAAVQIARKEKIGMGEALRFTKDRFVSYFSAPLVPLAGVLVFVILLIIYGLFHTFVPAFGDIVVDGIGWPLVLLAGLIMAVILVGLVGWPMMYATISAEGSDSFDALSRSYSYVLTNPWQYIWYSLVALAYGAVVVFFVGFMGSLMIYLGKWGVSQTPGTSLMHREPEYLFIYAPTSFGWHDLLTRRDLATSESLPWGVSSEAAGAEWHWWNSLGAGMVAFWLYLAFLMIVGFGYSYFWSASTIIYLLMRRKVDDTDIDEVYLAEDEAEEAYKASAPMPSGAPPAGGPPLTMVEPPSLKTSASAPAAEGEGNAPAAEGAS